MRRLVLFRLAIGMATVVCLTLGTASAQQNWTVPRTADVHRDGIHLVSPLFKSGLKELLHCLGGQQVARCNATVNVTGQLERGFHMLYVMERDKSQR